MVISHAACVVTCLVDSTFACWPFLARHSRGVRANIDLELHKLRHLHQLYLYTISCHHGPQHPYYKVIIRPTPQLTRNLICPLVRLCLYWYYYYTDIYASRWPRGLRCEPPAAVRLMGLRVWISPRTWTSVSYDCCVMSGRGLCLGLIARPEDSYKMWCV